jgi:site-specific recombinase XerD
MKSKDPERKSPARPPLLKGVAGDYSKEEVTKILNSMDNLKHRTILMLTYSAGLRVGEVVKLKQEVIGQNKKSAGYFGFKGRGGK